MGSLSHEELSRVIALVAEAKMHCMLAIQGTRPNTTARAHWLDMLERSTKAARAYVEQLGGLDRILDGYGPIAVDLRTCEKVLERRQAIFDGSAGREERAKRDA